MKMTNSFGKMVLAVGCAAAMAGAASAETWYLKANGAYNVNTLNQLSYWTNSVGNAGTGAPTTDDDQIVPANRTLRVSSITSKARSVTICGKLTHDPAGDVTWSNDGIILAPGGYYSFNTYTQKTPFNNIWTMYIKGKVTATGTAEKMCRFEFEQGEYSNATYRVAKLIGAEGSYIQVKDQNNRVVNNTAWISDASEFKGSVLCQYKNSANTSSSAIKDNGEYGGRIGFTGLDTPGTLTLGKNWTLGAEEAIETKAASVVLGDGVRIEACVGDKASCLVATSSLTVGSNVQIFLTSNVEAPMPGRYPVLTGPANLDAASFVFKVSPKYPQVTAELESENVGGVGTLYVKISDYRRHYVDAVSGNDAWDGSTSEIPSAEAIAAGGTIAGPKKTLVEAMKLAAAGDTIIAAEGTYDEGEVYSGVLTSNRVVVSRYVTLEAAGARDKTIIAGKISTSAGNVNGCWSNAVRCVALKDGAVVKGFTLMDGRTCTGSIDYSAHDCGGCAYGVESAGLIVDCVITNCGAAYRGPNFYGHVRLLRCRVESHVAGGEGLDFYQGGRAIDSLICGVGQSAYWNCQFVNCTFPSKYTMWGNVGALCYIRNCLHLYENSEFACMNRQTQVYNSYFCSKWTTDDTSSKDDLSRFNLSYNLVPCSSVTYRPAISSIAIGKGDLDMYLASTNGWAWTMQRQFTMKDMYGTDRLNGGALDLGAIQHCEVARYVDAVDGNDANDGRTAKTAKRTLKAIVEAVTSEGDYEGTIIHAAPGTYDEGEMFYNNCSNRVVVPKAVGLVADEGPAVTTIKGKLGTETAAKVGDDAVRCVYLNSLSWVRGFKITGGSTQKTTYTSSSGSGTTGRLGGGVYSGGGSQSAIVACEITGNGGGGDSDFRGGGGYCGTYIGCYVHDNLNSFQVYGESGMMINSALIGSQAHYGTVKHLNCTVTGQCNAMSWSSNATMSVNCYLSTTGRARHYINCHFKGDSFGYITHPTSGVIANYYDPDTCRFSVPLDVDSGYRPLAGSAQVDAEYASEELYDTHFPEYWACFKDVGLLGQQRVYNGAIDMGAGEYDIRSAVGRYLNRHRSVEVEQASADVLYSSDGVTIEPGASIAMKFTFKASGAATFTVTGDVTVTVDGVTIYPTGGVYTFSRGINSTAIVKIVNNGTTDATLGTCDLPLSGSMILFK